MNKKKEFNGQFKSKIKDSGSKKDAIQPKKFPKKEIPNKLKVNLSSSLKYITKKKNQKKFINENNYIYPQLIYKNLQKYNSDSEMKNIMLINNLINCKSCHFLATFKDYLITDYVEEFLRRIYFYNESIQRLPKLYNYYKNYLKFFCRPTFIESFSNEIIKNYGDLNAEYFYKNNLEKKKTHHETKRILDKKIIGKDFNKNNNDLNEQLVKTVFTKSIKNSIDNINEEDSSINNKKSNADNNIIISDFARKIQKDPLTDIWESDNNLISEGNSLLLMINEIKEIQNNQKIASKTIKIGNISNNNNKNNYEKMVPEETTYKTLNTDKNYNKENNSKNNHSNKDIGLDNILKAKTYTKYQKFDSIQNMVYSPKSRKNIGFSIKRDKTSIDKNEKLLSPKNKNLNTNNNNDKSNTNNKNHNSIVVNINININTNQNNNNINNNIKSPVHKINKNRYPLSPLSPLNINILNDKEYQKNEIPLSSARNKEKEKNKENIEENNYIKILKRKTDYSSLILSNKRNKKIVEINRIKSLNSIENNELAKKQNISCNKNILSNNKETKELIYKNNNIDKNVYFSPKKLGYKIKFINSMKDLENVNELNDKKFVYHKKQNSNLINSPLSKKVHYEKKYFSYKRLDIANSEMNIVNNNIEN